MNSKKTRNIIIGVVSLIVVALIVLLVLIAIKRNKNTTTVENEVETVEAETDAVDNEADSTLVENSTNEISNETVEVETETTENETSEAETDEEFEEAPLSDGETAVELENEYVDGFSDGVMIIEKEDGTIDIIPDTVTPIRKMMESMTEEEFEAYMEEVYKRIEEEERRARELFEEANRRKDEGMPDFYLDME